MADEIITVVGAGEVGRVFARVAPAHVVRRGQRIADAPPRTAIVVSVREDDLAPLVPELVPYRDRVVLVQNGWIDPVVKPLEGCTRGLLWFTAKGDFFEVLAPSLFHGPRASEIESLVGAGGVAAREIADRTAFMREVIVKLAWNNVVGLPLAVHGVDLETYLRDHEDEARAIVEETCAAGSAEIGAKVDAGVAWSRLVTTTNKLGWVKGSRKAVTFRNGAVVRMGQAHGVPTPVNARLTLPGGPS